MAYKISNNFVGHVWHFIEGSNTNRDFLAKCGEYKNVHYCLAEEHNMIMFDMLMSFKSLHKHVCSVPVFD